MQELTSEEEANLRELVNIYERGESVKNFVNAHLTKPQESVYISLVEKKVLEGGEYQMPFAAVGMTNHWYGDLTSAGRCYFKDKSAREAKESDRLERQRRHDYAIAAIGVLGGLFSGALGSLLVDAFTSDAVRFATSALWHIAMRSFWPF